jgi:hypothetical protein
MRMTNALAESFVDSYKTELIADRVWRTHAQLEIATVEYIGWFNHARLHASLGNIPPAEYELSWQLSQLEQLGAKTAIMPIKGRAATAGLAALQAQNTRSLNS